MSPRGAEPAPDAVPVPGPGSASPRPLFGGCWSCRLLSGAGLLMAAIWVFQGPRSTMKKGIPPSMGALAQITFAAGLGAWGIVILADPVGTWHRKQP
ncbi:distal membrane-arm assembly complex protein 1 [Poecile atricapillus]|uniref:distal membrane-arm assembly complex protein 1 n=1 Tax=Poecile atricapillus TaxID=48891 RepID=UPI002739F9C9|nr:distal membrane-arm assembly complex protein 1 [Poecile atricapillus]